MNAFKGRKSQLPLLAGYGSMVHWFRQGETKTNELSLSVAMLGALEGPNTARNENS